jgi:hypothetical protein
MVKTYYLNRTFVARVPRQRRSCASVHAASACCTIVCNRLQGIEFRQISILPRTGLGLLRESPFFNRGSDAGWRGHCLERPE